MAAPRSTSLRALRQLSNQHAAIPRRALHITGVQSAQPANPADKASLYAARTLPDLKLECQRRSIRAAGSKSEVSRTSLPLYHNHRTNPSLAGRAPLQP